MYSDCNKLATSHFHVWSSNDNSATFFCPCWGLLHHTVVGLGIIKSQRHFMSFSELLVYSYFVKSTHHIKQEVLERTCFWLTGKAEPIPLHSHVSTSNK
jgi:hypothetical protein